jgi:hypothetical protein
VAEGHGHPLVPMNTQQTDRQPHKFSNYYPKKSFLMDVKSMRKLFYYRNFFKKKHKLIFYRVLDGKQYWEIFGQVFIILFCGVNLTCFFKFLENLAKFFGIKKN